MNFGILHESRLNEKRVCLTPNGAKSLVKRGHIVFVESGAGDSSGFTDQECLNKGAQIIFSYEEIYERSDVLLKILPITEDSLTHMIEGQTAFTFQDLAVSSAQVFRGLTEKKITLIGMEIMETEDGSTLQMGIGAIPDATLHYLKEKRNLGIRTEMFSDGVVELVESGVINGEEKTLHPGKVVSSIVMGSQHVYDFIHEDPFMEFHPTDYVNDPYIIAQNKKMVAINSSIEIDLTGQVCSDSMGHNNFSSIGGQVDFMRGAARNNGGIPIIAMPTSAKKVPSHALSWI